MNTRKSVATASALFAAAALGGLLAGTAHAATLPTAGVHAARTAAAASATLAGTRAHNMDDAPAAGKHDCKGQNACKGQGGCKTSDNGCKGKNSCKGKGGCNSQS